MPGYDLIFSNAALQWLPDHARLLPDLWARVNPGGQMAVQLPTDDYNPRAASSPTSPAGAIRWARSTSPPTPSCSFP
jgi:trans-aconitate methyltransferase